jgi:ribosomal protein S18 acetylase RimI-like enzyme
VDDLARAIAFRRRLLQRICPETEPFRYGTAFLDPRFPVRHDSNLLLVDRSIAGVGVGSLHREADRILGSRRLRHRKIVFDRENDALRVAMGLAELGYEGTTVEVMVLRGELQAVRASIVEEMRFEQIRPLSLEALSREPFARSQQVIDQLTDVGSVLEAKAGCRFFVAREPGGMMASSCELYVDDDEAQIEDVRTLEEYRRAGLASACVAAAVDAARASGARWIHLHAAADDWPKEWYSRLGFAPVGALREFTLWSADG